MTPSMDIGSATEENLKPASSYISTDLSVPVKLRLGKSGIAADKPLTIPQYFLNAVNKFGQTPALVYQDEKASTADGWTSLTFHEYKDRVEQVARMFVHLGLVPRTSVGILSFNCPEWFYSELGALFVGGVVAGIYTTNSAEAVYHVLSTSDAGICIVDDTRQMEKVRTIKSRLPNLKAIIQIHGPFEDYVGVDEGYYRWSDLFAMKFGAEVQEEVEKRFADIAPNECALLIYTSGTVGMPKAVMLSHDCIIYDTKGISIRLTDMEVGHEVVVSYLPLNHIAAQIFDVFLPIENGGTCYFADRNALKGTLVKALTKGRPTRFFGVPRVFEKIQENLAIAEANSSMFSKFLLGFSRRLMQNYHLSVMQGEPASSWRYWLASKVIARVKLALGLDHCKTFLTGGAPVSQDLKKFFLGLDATLVDIYGMSELSGASNFNLHPTDMDSSGKALDGTEMKIFNPDESGFGEVCIRGRLTFMGYLNDMDTTTACLKEDGWVHSGDVGYINTNGDLVVSGRQKEIVITAGGENIPPTHIEALVKRELPGISNAVLIGDKRKYLTMLLTIKTATDPETARPLNDLLPDAIEWMKSLELPNFTHLSDIFCEDVGTQAHPKVIESIQEGINRANKNAISRAHTIQKFAILPHDFSIPTGELGPTLKLRRNIIQEKYADIIDNLYK